MWRKSCDYGFSFRRGVFVVQIESGGLIFQHVSGFTKFTRLGFYGLVGSLGVREITRLRLRPLARQAGKDVSRSGPFRVSLTGARKTSRNESSAAVCCEVTPAVDLPRRRSLIGAMPR